MKDYAERVAQAADMLLMLLDTALTNLERQHKTGSPYWRRLRVRKRLVQTILTAAGETNIKKLKEMLIEEFFQSSDKELLLKATKENKPLMNLKDFGKLIQEAYAYLCRKSPAPIKDIWESFHLLNKNVSLAEFKILLKQLHESDFQHYQMDRGSSRFPYNRQYGIMADNGLLCYFRYVPKKQKARQ